MRHKPGELLLSVIILLVLCTNSLGEREPENRWGLGKGAPSMGGQVFHHRGCGQHVWTAKARASSIVGSQEDRSLRASASARGRRRHSLSRIKREGNPVSKKGMF